MADGESVELPIFNGEYPVKVDGSRRIMLPARWLNGKSDGAPRATELTVIVWSKSVNGPCLRVLPVEKMAELMKNLNDMPNSDPKKEILKRVIGGDSMQVAVDKQGRITLPETMAKKAGIESEAIAVGLLDRFEIWSTTRREAVKQTDAALAREAFQLLE